VREVAGYVTARLLTREAALVRDLTLPPLPVPPTIILYGHRAFIRVEESLMYVEASSYEVPFEDVEEEA
jgi:hypothetical protein